MSATSPLSRIFFATSTKFEDVYLLQKAGIMAGTLRGKRAFVEGATVEQVKAATGLDLAVTSTEAIG